MVKKIDAAEFHELLKRDEQVVVKFGAAWCGPCKVMTRQLEECEGEVFEINIDEDFELAASLGIKTIPRLKVFKSGQLIREHVGIFSTVDDAFRFVHDKQTTRWRD